MKAAAGIVVATVLEVDRAKQVIAKTYTDPPPYKVTGPLVSVVIIALDEEKYLPITFQGLENQTYDNIEVIVVDNMSTDETVKIARDHGARVIWNKDYNLSQSRNMGADVSHGPIIIFMDADTFPQANAIEKVVQAIENGAEMVHVNRVTYDDFFYSFQRGLLTWLPPVDKYGFNGQFIAITREAYLGAGKWDETQLPQEGASEDHEFIRRVMSMYPGKTVYLRTLYASTSARRFKVEGYLAPVHWQARAIR